MIDYDIGDKVVCKDGNFSPVVNGLYAELPKQDSVYVVRDIKLGIALDCKTGEVSVLLVGITNPKANVSPFRERGFAGWRFEKLKAVTTTEEKPIQEPKELQPV